MKRWLILALLSCLAIGQTTIVPMNQAGAGPSHYFKGEPWQFTSGLGAIFTWTPLTGTNYACITLANNNPSNLHILTLQGFVTQDPNPNTFSYYSGNPSRFSQVLNPNATVTLANSASQASIQGTSFTIAGAAFAYISVSGGASAAGSPDTFDVLEVDSVTPCYNVNSLGQNGFPTSLRPCNYVFTGSAATGTQTVIQTSSAFAAIGSVSVYPVWHICSYAISGPAAGASSALSINLGSNATTCAAPSGNAYWSIVAPVGIFETSLVGDPEIFTLPGGKALCFSNAGLTTTATISIAYDYW